MSLNILIAKKNPNVKKSDNQTSDRISPDGGYPSPGKEPETLFARKDLVKYSLIKRGHQGFSVESYDKTEPWHEFSGEQVMNAHTAFAVDTDLQTQKFLTLLELSKAIASHRDLSGLFHDLTCRLRNLFAFRDLAVMLHDDQKNVMRSYIMDGCAEAWLPNDPNEVPI